MRAGPRPRRLTSRRHGEAGVALINALAAVAVAASIVSAMMALQEAALARTGDFADLARAHAAARGSETVALAALRRDLREAPGIDHSGEPWARLSEQDAPIRDGTLTVRIEDAQGRFDINALADGGARALGQLRAIVAALGLPAWLADALAARIAAAGPVADLATLAGGPVEPALLGRLAAWTHAAHGRAPVNLNAAEEGLIAALLGNAGAAKALVALRTRKGFIDRADLSALRIIAPQGTGLTSRLFRLSVDVRVGAARVTETALIERTGRGARGDARVVDRR